MIKKERMKHLFLVLSGCLIQLAAYSQILNESFSDNDLSSMPTWQGDITHFIQNSSGQLQLNRTTSDTSLLATETDLLAEMEWSFFIRLNFSPSSLNFSRVYLLADQPVLTGPLYGYYLKFGETGSNDAIELFRQQGTSHTSIARAPNSEISSAFSLYVKVIKDSSDQWQIFSGTTTASVLKATGISSAPPASGFFGFYCQYTSSNASKFYFDSVYAGPVRRDLQAPKPEYVRANDNRHLELRFNEAIDTSVFNNNTFKIDGHPGSLLISSASDAKTISITLSDSLTNGDEYTMRLTSVRDLSGNQLDTLIHFTWFNPMRFDVIINELMVDPTPSQGLPEYEYIELFNKTDHDVDLSGWTMKIGTSSKLITNATIPPHGFILLISQSAEPDFALLGNRSVIQGLSTTALVNTGTSIQVSDKHGTVIDEVNYNDSWYKESTKSNGGFSLERIDPFVNCAGHENWRAAHSSGGGTPGIPNSVLNPQSSVPMGIQSLCISTERSIEINLTQLTDASRMMQMTAYEITPSISIDSITSEELYTDRLTIHTSSAFNDATIYHLKINQAFTCEGVPVSFPGITFSSRQPMQGDLVINEIMADPEPAVSLPPYEYAEIVNTSSMPLFTRGLRLCTGSSCGDLDCQVIQPGETVILCNNQHAAHFQNYGKVIGVTSFPALSNEGTTLHLDDQGARVLSVVNYTSSWYQNNAKDDGGYSLEQIDAGNYCSGEPNWRASRSVTGGTPGRANSVAGSNPDIRTPVLAYATIRDSLHVTLYFSEPMKAADIKKELISINHDIGSPAVVTPFNEQLNSFLLELDQPLQRQTVYTVTMNGTDCSGNELSRNSTRFAYPEEAEAGEILFNEILFEGHTTDSEFFELYNHSSKPVSLSTLTFCEWDTLLMKAFSEKKIDTTGYVLFPGEYVAITNSTDQLFAFTRCLSPEAVLPAHEGLSLNSEGTVALVSTQGQLIDRLNYSNEQHFSMLTSTKGISLEKLSPDASSLKNLNWHSASSRSGWATPGYKNSQYQDAEGNGSYHLSPEVFTPDNDGYHDVLTITFNGIEPGTLANVFIFSATGVLCRRLVQNDLCGTSGSYAWDGTNDAGEISGNGIYIVQFETFDPPGTVKKQKKICVLHRRL